MITLCVKDFRKAVRATAFAATDASIHETLSGVRFECGSGCLRAVATDGHRLALCEVECLAQGQSESFIVARRKLQELDAVLRTMQADILLQIYVAGDSVVFAGDGEIARLPIIAGQFPTWHRVFPPEDGCFSSWFDRAAFQDALTWARNQTTWSDRRVTVWIQEERVFVAPTRVEDMRPVAVQISAESTGDAYGVFNADYLRDALGVLPAGEVELRFKPAGNSAGICNPVEFRSVTPGKYLVRQVIMPCYPGVSPTPPPSLT